MRTSLVVVASFLLNLVFIVLNFLVFEAGGSHAVLSQAVNAATDLTGGLMILWGQWASSLPASPTHPFGRGKERFFWAYSAGLVTFSLAGAFLLVFGFEQVSSPHDVGAITASLGVVAVTLVGNAASISVVLWELRRDGGTVRELLASAHQGVKTVFLQDLVSVVGGAVSLVALFLVQRTGLEFIDGLAAAMVGGLLLFTGFALAGEGRELLVGRGIGEEEGRAILSMVERYPFVRQVVGMQSMMLGPDDRLVALRINFADEMSTDDVEMHIDQLRTFIRGEFPQIKHLLIEPGSAAEERRGRPGFQALPPARSAASVPEKAGTKERGRLRRAPPASTGSEERSAR